MIHNKLQSWMGLDPTNQDFTLGGQDIAGNQVGGTNFAYNTAEELYKTGDPLAQKLLRQNMMDSSMSLDSLLGFQSASGGSGAIANQQYMSSQSQTQNNMAQALMAQRNQDIKNSMGYNRQGMIGDQYTKSMDYRQDLDNKYAQGAFASKMFGLGGNLLMGPAGLAGTSFTGLFGKQGDAESGYGGQSNFNRFQNYGMDQGWWGGGRPQGYEYGMQT